MVSEEEEQVRFFFWGQIFVLHTFFFLNLLSVKLTEAFVMVRCRLSAELWFTVLCSKPKVSKREHISLLKTQVLLFTSLLRCAAELFTSLIKT